MEKPSRPPPPFLIHTKATTRLWIMPSPTFQGGLARTLCACRQSGILHLASLIEHHETGLLELDDLPNECLANNITLRKFPLIDREPPQSLPSFFNFVTGLTAQFLQGQSIGVHCKSGIGRSGMLAAAILGQLGHSRSEALAKIETGRNLQAPNTPAQLDWLETNWQQISRHDAR